MVKKILIAIAIIIIVILVAFWKPITQGLGIFYGVVSTKKIALKHAPDAPDSVNVLLLGIGGGNHDGPNLSDTIILAHIDIVKNTVDLISIPRDLWIPDLGDKINSAYATGQDQGKGIDMAKAVIGKVTGQSIDYVVVLDFDGFVEMVNELGGVDVTVPNTFTDNAYPITGNEEELCGHSQDEIASLSAQEASGSASDLDLFPCRYKTIHFTKGVTHMDGETALEFARSRHALGAEGTDFARSRRQHNVIAAVKAKVLSLGIILNPVKLIQMYDTIKANVNTDIQESEYSDFIKLAQKMKDAKINNAVIDMGDDTSEDYGLLINPPLSAAQHYAWVLTPRVGDGDFSEIHTYVSCVIKYGQCAVTQTGVASPTPTPRPTSAVTPADKSSK